MLGVACAYRPVLPKMGLVPVRRFFLRAAAPETYEDQLSTGFRRCYMPTSRVLQVCRDGAMLNRDHHLGSSSEGKAAASMTQETQ